MWYDVQIQINYIITYDLIYWNLIKYKEINAQIKKFVKKKYSNTQLINYKYIQTVIKISNRDKKRNNFIENKCKIIVENMLLV